MSAVQPQLNQDPTRGMRLVSNVSPDREQTRYLFFPGQVLDPDRVFSTEHLREAGGGEEVQSRCLRRTVGGLVPRGKLTPMEVWTEGLPSILIGEGLEAETVHIQGPATPELLGMTQRPGRLLGQPLTHVKFYPGSDIVPVLRANQGKGLVEIKALKGVGWYEDEAETRPGVPQILNRAFFPSTVPPTLRELRARIAEVRDGHHAAGSIVPTVAEEMLAACDQFERWAQMMLSVEHTLLRQRVSHLHTYTYSPLGRELLRQLEVQPQDNIIEGFGGGINAAQLEGVLAKFGGGGQLSPELIAGIAGAVVREMMAAQQQTPDTQKSDAAPEQGEPAKAEEPKAAESPEGGQPVPRRRKQAEE